LVRFVGGKGGGWQTKDPKQNTKLKIVKNNHNPNPTTTH